MDVAAVPSPFLNLLIVLRNLRGTFGGFCAPGLLDGTLGLLITNRLSLVISRLDRTVGRFLTGRLWRGGTQAPRSPAKSGRVPVRLWPRDFGWMLRLGGWKAAGYGSQLRAVLETPEMVALLTASPEAGRVLRPICRMLGIEVTVLRPGVVVVVREKIAQEWVRKPRMKVKPEPFRIPLPRGVLAAARRQGYGKIR